MSPKSALEQVPDFWWRDPVEHCRLRAKYGSSQKASTMVTPSCAPRNAQGWWRKLTDAGCVDASGNPTGVPAPEVTNLRGRPPSAPKPPDGSVEVEVDPSMVRWSDSDLIAFHQLDPELNIVTKRVAKRWNQALGEGKVAEMNGLTLTIESRYPADTILPARSEGWKPPKRGKAKPVLGRPRVITVSTDWHEPYSDDGLFDCYLQVLEELEPDEDWDIGDLVDYPQPSRHRMTKGFEATPQECVDARYKHDACRVAAAPGAVHKRLYGNHDVRVDIAVTEKVGAHVARLARAGDTLPVLDLGHLLRYDELGIEVLRPDGDYHSVVAKLAEGLNVSHGTKSGPFGGAVKRILRRVASMLTGHDHKQSILQRVNYDEDDNAVLTVSASIGCGCQRALARSYAEDADAHLGFAVVTDHGAGSFNVELARYDDTKRELYFRGKVYRPR